MVGVLGLVLVSDSCKSGIGLVLVSDICESGIGTCSSCGYGLRIGWY